MSARFSDISEELEIDASADDRVLFCVVDREIGSIGEAWAILADRYPHDARLRVLAAFHDLDSHGVDAFRDADTIARTVSAVIDACGASEREACAAFVAIAARGAENAAEDAREAFAALERAVAPIPDERAARRMLERLEERVLDEAEERTREGKPFGEREERVDKRVIASAAPARPYSPTAGFAIGDRVIHAKFGEGVVLDKAEGKIEVAFADGRKRLVSA